jgi:AAA ATPase domain
MTAVVGRDRELAEITSFLELADEAPRILLLEGEAGIGKSTLWRSGVDLAHERGYRVFSCTATRTESELSFTALRDLMGDAFDDIADELPRPQGHALAVALLVEEPEGPPPDTGVLGVAFLGALRVLAASTTTVLTIEDRLERRRRDIHGRRRPRARIGRSDEPAGRQQPDHQQRGQRGATRHVCSLRG